MLTREPELSIYKSEQRAVASERPSPSPDSLTRVSSAGDKSSTAVKAVLLFVIAAGTAAAVWFSGLLQ